MLPREQNPGQQYSPGHFTQNGKKPRRSTEVDPLSYNEYGFTRLVKCYNCSIPRSHTVLTVSGNNILAGTGGS